MINNFKCLIILSLMFYSSSLLAQIKLDEINIIKIKSLKGTPSLVTIKSREENIIITGVVKKSKSSPGRRMFGDVQIEYLSNEEEVLASDVVKVYRRSPSKHTQKVYFKMVKSNLPHKTSTIRIRYD